VIDGFGETGLHEEIQNKERSAAAEAHQGVLQDQNTNAATETKEAVSIAAGIDGTEVPSRDLDDPALFSEVGLIDEAHISGYREAVQELLRAAQHDTPASVLLAMKSIVIAARNLAESVEDYESDEHFAKTDEEIEAVNILRAQLSMDLTELMNHAKDFAMKSASDPEYRTVGYDILSQGCTKLTGDIYELVKLIRIRSPSGFLKGRADIKNYSPDIHQNRNLPNPAVELIKADEPVASPEFPVEELKVR